MRIGGKIGCGIIYSKQKLGSFGNSQKFGLLLASVNALFMYVTKLYKFPKAITLKSHVFQILKNHSLNFIKKFLFSWKFPKIWTTFAYVNGSFYLSNINRGRKKIP